MLEQLGGERKKLILSIENPDEIYPLAKALASYERLQIISLLEGQTLNVNEIAKCMDIPMSSAAMHVRVLEDAGLIMTEVQPGHRGAMKLCSRRLDHVDINLVPYRHNLDNIFTINMPVGSFSNAQGIEPTCGLASEEGPIGFYDNPRSFFLAERRNAQILWFRVGSVEYQFGLLALDTVDIKWLELSFECCSEAPMYRNQWKSDIGVSINGVDIGVWTSPGECGGRSGVLNPDWWTDAMAQYGILKVWRVDDTGSYVDNEKVSDVTINDLKLREHDCIGVKIGVSPDAEYAGGINLFGEKFGNHAQGLVMRIGYRASENKQ